MTTTSSTTPILHRFLAIDEGRATLMHVNEFDRSQDWTVEIGHPQSRDMQLIGGGRILIGHHHGWSASDISTGNVLFEYTALEGVTAVRRQANGHTVIAGVDIAGTTGVVVMELDGALNEVKRSIYPGDYVRLIRQTVDGTLLMSCNEQIREGDREGNYIQEFPVEGFYHAWKGLRLENGNLLISAGYGAFMVELDPTGGVVRKFGGKADVDERVNPFFYAMFQLLENRHVVVANWQGHGEGFGESGVQLLEFDTQGEIVWSWSEADKISSLQGVLVLDGLDLDQLHDEREGCMRPLRN